MVPNERTKELGENAGQTPENDFGDLRIKRIVKAQLPDRSRYLWDAFDGYNLDEDGNYPEWI